MPCNKACGFRVRRDGRRFSLTRRACVEGPAFQPDTFTHDTAYRHGRHFSLTRAAPCGGARGFQHLSSPPLPSSNLAGRSRGPGERACAYGTSRHFLIPGGDAWHKLTRTRWHGHWGTGTRMGTDTKAHARGDTRRANRRRRRCRWKY